MARRLRPAVIREGQSIVFLREGQMMLASGPVRATECSVSYDHQEIYAAGRFAPLDVIPVNGTVTLNLQGLLPDKATLRIAKKVATKERRRLAREAKRDERRKRKAKR